jgi:hypothetical protein
VTSVPLKNKRSHAWDEQDCHVKAHLESTDYWWAPLGPTQKIQSSKGKPSITPRGKRRLHEIIYYVKGDGHPQPPAMNPSTASVLPLVYDWESGFNCSRKSGAMDNSAWCMSTTLRAVGAIVGLSAIYWLYRVYAVGILSV